MRLLTTPHFGYIAAVVCLLTSSYVFAYEKDGYWWMNVSIYDNEVHMDIIRGRSFAIYSQLKKGRRYLGLETFQSNARKTHLSIKL